MSSSGRFCGSLLPAAVDTEAENSLLAQLKQRTQHSCVCEEGEQTPQQSQFWTVQEGTSLILDFSGFVHAQDLSARPRCRKLCTTFSWHVLGFALSLLLITHTDFAEVPGGLPQEFSWDSVVTAKDRRKIFKIDTNLLMPNPTKAQWPHLPPCQGSQHSPRCPVLSTNCWTERVLPTQISLWSLFYHKEQLNYHMAAAYARRVQVTAGNNENQHQDNDLSLPQQTEHLSLPSPLLLKTPSQFLEE